MNNRILVTCGHLQRHIERYRAEIEGHNIELHIPNLVGQQFDSAQMAMMLPEADTVIAGDDEMTAQALESGVKGRLRSVVKWGIGVDNVDRSAAKRFGLPVYNTPGMFSNEVADLAFAYALGLARSIHKMDRDVRAGRWVRYEGMSLAGKTAGVIGLGSIGRAIARRAVAFGLRVMGYDVVVFDSDTLSSLQVTQTSLLDIYTQSDIIFLACNLTAESRHLINADAFAQMKEGVMIVNVARGAIIDESALCAALQSGKIGSAGLDVFETEPLPADSLLRQFDTCLFGTHSGSSTAEAIQRVNRATVDIALALLGIVPERLVQYNRVA